MGLTNPHSVYQLHYEAPSMLLFAGAVHKRKHYRTIFIARP